MRVTRMERESRPGQMVFRLWGYLKHKRKGQTGTEPGGPEITVNDAPYVLSS